MKKARSVLMGLLFALTVLYPAGILVSAGCGYTFRLISVPAFAVVIAALSAGICSAFDSFLIRTLPNEGLAVRVMSGIS